MQIQVKITFLTYKHDGNLVARYSDVLKISCPVKRALSRQQVSAGVCVCVRLHSMDKKKKEENYITKMSLHIYW